MHPKIKMLHELIKHMDMEEGKRHKMRGPKMEPAMLEEQHEPAMHDESMEEEHDLELPEDKEEKKNMILKRLGKI